MGLFDGGIFDALGFETAQSAGASGLPPGVGPANYSQALADALSKSQEYSRTAWDPNSQSRGQQQTFLDALQRRMQGDTPSLAEMQLARSMQQAQQNAASMAASQRGVTPALAARLAAQQQAGLTGDAASQAAMLRAQENLYNTNLYGNTLAGIRGQDIQSAMGQIQGNTNQIGALGGLQNQQQGFSNQIAADRAGSHNALTGQIYSLIGQGASSAFGGGGGGGGDAGGLSQMISSTPAPTMPVMGAYSGGEVDLYGLNDISNRAGGTVKLPSGKPFSHGGAVDNDLKASLFMDALQAKGGGKVPGKAETEGDSPENDKVPALLSPGEIVIPRSIAKDPEAAKDFVQAIHDRHSSKKKVSGYGDVLKAKQRASA